MEPSDILKKLETLVTSVCSHRIENFKPESRFVEDLGMDSLDVVEFIMAVEEEFGIDLPDEEAEKLPAVADMVRYLEEHAE
jgi:acyl carrier protein